MSELKEYEINFLKYYSIQYNVAFIKVKHNKGKISTDVTLYSPNKKAIRHKPTYCGVTVKTMFQWLEENKIYKVIDLINERK